MLALEVLLLLLLLSVNRDLVPSSTVILHSTAYVAGCICVSWVSLWL